jgi:WD40 repeat protein/ABC-type cobalamin/Fe3+-siderophores transport system ATPase subunit
MPSPQLEDGGLAIVIGINTYINHIPPLKSATKDAGSLAKILREQYNYKVLELLDTNATCQALQNLLENLKRKQILINGQLVQIQECNRLLFYFAGHGIALNAEESEDTKPTGYLIPQDATLDNREDNRESWLSMQELHDALTALDCRHLLIILDCCFAGSFRWSGLHRNAVLSRRVYQESYRHFTKNKAQQVITSAAHDEKALDTALRFGNRGMENDGHSPFANLLLKVLAGDRLKARGDKFLEAVLEDSVITAHELFAYLQNKLGERTQNRQTPSLYHLKYHDKGEYIFPIPGFNPNDLQSLKLTQATNPYRGLEPFEKEHKDLFFGRKTLVHKLREVVDKKLLTVVLGVSGSGKSSLVKAGLISDLESGEENQQDSQQQWQFLDPIRPGEFPLSALNRVLADNELPTVARPGEDPTSDQTTLAESLRVGCQRHPGSKLLLVIDQCEELITLCRDEQEQKGFLELLAEALASKELSEQLRIVLTLRSDFEPQVRETIKQDDWQQTWQNGRFIVTPMNREELQEAIEEPAAARALFFESPRLVNDLIDEVIQMPGTLPLLSFTLSKLYLMYLKAEEGGKRNDRTITQDDYQELGGVTRSLIQSAEQVYSGLVNDSPAYKKTIRNIALRMVTSTGGELARRRVLLSELEYPAPEENQRVVEVRKRFLEARLTVEGLDTNGNQYVEPAHDALVRGWPKLSQWINNQEEPERLTLQQSLTDASNLWHQSKEIGFLWSNDPRLVQVKDSKWLNKREEEFVQRSIQQRKDDLEKTEQQRDEAMQGQISALAALSEARFQDDQLGALIHILKAARILQQLRNSESQWIQEDIYLRTQVVLRQILSKVKEFNRLEDKDIPLNMVAELSFTSNRAIPLLDSQGRLVKLEFTSDQQLILMQDSQRIIRFWQSDGTLVERIPPGLSLVKSSSDGQMFAIRAGTGNNADLIRLLTLNSIKPITLRAIDNDNLMTICFSPNGQLIASGGWFGWLYLWKTDGTTVRNEGIGGNSLNAIDFSPNGEMFATGSNDGKIRLWNQNGDSLKTIEAHRDAIWGVSFSPDGETLASVSTDTTVKIWKTDGTLLTTHNGHKNIVRAVCFSSDGQILASASNDGSVRLWRPNGSKLKGLDDHHTGAVYAVRFNPKQPMIATTSGQGQLILWSQDGRLLKNWEKGHNGTITAIDFSPNGRMFVTAAGDREVKLWKLDDDKNKQDFRPHTLGNHTGEIHLPTGFGVSFSSDNQTILLGSGSQDGKGYLELCDSESKLCRIIAEYDYQVLTVCFSPDGQMFALGKGDGSVEIWRKEEDNFKLLKTFNQHDNLVLVVCFSPDGKFLATGSADKTVKLWQIDNILNNTNSTTVTPTKIFAHTDQVTAVRFSPNGEFIATASDDKTVKLWNLDGTLKKTLHGHNDQINALDFSTDGQTLASASNDKIAILWNLELELGLDQLIHYGCEWISGYLTNNPNVSDEDRKLLKEFPTLQYESQEWM